MEPEATFGVVYTARIYAYNDPGDPKSGYYLVNLIRSNHEERGRYERLLDHWKSLVDGEDSKGPGWKLTIQTVVTAEEIEYVPE